MIIYKERAGGMDLTVVEYKDIVEFANVRRSQTYYSGSFESDKHWAGGSVKDMYRWCELGDESYAAKADKYVSQFANVALEDYDMTLEWNDQHGELDYEAALAGEEYYMYGPTFEKTDRAPVNVYMDQWASCTLSPTEMMRRGVAVLALVQALAIYRPVNAYVATGTRHSSANVNLIQIIRVPTNPMDLGRAAWMLASPCFFRQGQLPLTFEHARTSSNCGVPTLSRRSWQKEAMGKWLGEKDGVQDVVHLPLMIGGDPTWKSDEKTLEWVKHNMSRFVET